MPRRRRRPTRPSRAAPPPPPPGPLRSHTKIRAMRDAPAAPAVINLTAGAAGGSPREDAPLLKADSEARV